MPLQVKFCVISFLIPFMFLSANLIAEEAETLTVDRVISSNIALSFPNEENITPRESEFELLNYVVMSNDLGERWAVITINNLSSGRRTLESQHVMALFANGERSFPLALKLPFEGGETQSITVSFGENKFPILSINTDAG